MVNFVLKDYIFTNPDNYSKWISNSEFAEEAIDVLNKYMLFCDSREKYSFWDVPLNRNYRLMILYKDVIKLSGRPEFSFIGVLIARKFYQERINILELYEKVKGIDFERIENHENIKLSIEKVTSENSNDSSELESIDEIQGVKLQHNSNGLSKYSLANDDSVKTETVCVLRKLYDSSLNKWFDDYIIAINPEDSYEYHEKNIVITKKVKIVSSIPEEKKTKSLRKSLNKWLESTFKNQN